MTLTEPHSRPYLVREWRPWERPTKDDIQHVLADLREADSTVRRKLRAYLNRTGAYVIDYGVIQTTDNNIYQSIGRPSTFFDHKSYTYKIFWQWRQKRWKKVDGSGKTI